MTQLELQMLRQAVLSSLSRDTAAAATIWCCQETAFPKVDDPEWEDWYQNMEQRPPSIAKVLPEFLEELLLVKDKVEAVALEWDKRLDVDNLRTPEHVFWCLKEMVQFAKRAKQHNVGVLSQVIGL